MLPETVLSFLSVLVPAAPAAVFALLGVAFLGRKPPAEKVTAALVLGGLSVSMLAMFALSLAWLAGSEPALVIDVGQWFGEGRQAFEIVFVLDRLSAVVLPLVGSVTLVVARFAVPYMHREAGFARFFAQLMLFASGIGVVVMAGSADVLILGWECVGLASAMLVTFFQERSAPARAATRVFTTYRLCDVGLLVGTMMMHVMLGSPDFHKLFGNDGWPGGVAHLDPTAATAIAAAFAVAAIGKSAQLPVGGWLPRAMEGPTPSSALFYGGPAVHAGVYLLLRLAPLLEEASVVRAVLLVVGIATAYHSSMLCRVQNDQKCALGYATMTQLGLMVAECGLGWWSLAQFHLVTHICLRTHQLLRAPSALQDALAVRTTNEGDPLGVAEFVPAVLPDRLRLRAYHLGLERTHVETLLERWILQPVLSFGAFADRLERGTVDRLAAPLARSSREPRAGVVLEGESR